MSAVDVQKFHYALVSRIPESFTYGNNIDYMLANRQHHEYTEILRKLGIDVLELPAEEKHPSCVLVADTAVVINGTALICRPSDNRLGETSLVRQTLRNDLGLRIVEVDNERAKLEGTDVLFTGKEIIVGVGNSTNKDGAQSVAKAFPEYAVTTVQLPPSVKHLQQIMTVAGPDIVVVSRSKEGSEVLQEMITRATFSYRVIRVDEEAAANVVYANSVILHLDDRAIPKSYPIWEAKFDNRLCLDVSELLKCRDYLLSGAAILVSKPGNYSKTFQTSLEKGHHELD